MHGFATHMLGHLVVGDLVPLSVVVVVRLRIRTAAAAVALPVWLANLVAWHVPTVWDAALRHTWLHALQHLALLGAGAILWAAVIRSQLGVGARLVIVGLMMLAGIVLSSVLLWWPHSLYADAASLGDQRLGGGLMLLEGMVVAISAAAWLILTVLREPDAEGTSPSP